MKKLLPFKIRPFNMANFSGGQGYLFPTFLFYVMPVTYVLNLIASSLMTFLPAKIVNSNGWVKIKTVKKCLFCIYLPVAAIIAIPLSIASALTDAFGIIYTTGTIWVYIASVFFVLFPFLLIFFSVLISVYVLYVSSNMGIDKETGEFMVKAKSVIGLSFLFLFIFSIFACVTVLILGGLIDEYDY